jgi:hypothetical protein
MKSKHIRDTDSMPINAKAFRQHVLRNAYQVEIETVRSHTLSLKVAVPGVSLAGIAVTYSGIAGTVAVSSKETKGKR